MSKLHCEMPTLHLGCLMLYMPISHGNALVMRKNQEMDGNHIIELAGQGCIYMLAHVSCIVFTVALITY